MVFIPLLPPKETLGKCGNEADLDKQTHNSLGCSDNRLWIAWLILLREEASTMESGYAHHECFIPLQMPKAREDESKPEDENHIQKNTSQWPIPITRQQPEEP